MWFLIRPVNYELPGPKEPCQGYLLEADTEQEAVREAGQRWGLVHSIVRDDPEPEK